MLGSRRQQEEEAQEGEDWLQKEPWAESAVAEQGADTGHEDITRPGVAGSRSRLRGTEHTPFGRPLPSLSQ